MSYLEMIQLMTLFNLLVSYLSKTKCGCCAHIRSFIINEYAMVWWTMTSEKSPVNRRKFLRGAAATGALAGIAGCSTGSQNNGGNTSPTSGSGNSSGGSETIQLLASDPTEGDGAKQLYNEIVDAFNKESKHTLEMMTVGTEQANRRARSLQAAGKTPHLVSSSCRDCFQLNPMDTRNVWNNSNMPDLVSDQVQELADLFSTIAKPDADDPFLLWPVSVEFFQGVWDVDWLEEAGYAPEEVNWTAGALDWESDVMPIFGDMMSSSLGKQDGSFPTHLTLKPGDVETQQQWIAQFGGSPYAWVNTDITAEAVTRPEAIEAIKYQKRLWDEGYANPNSIEWGDEEATPQMWDNKLGYLNTQDTNDNWASFRETVPQEMKNGRYTWSIGQKGPKGESTVLGDMTAFVWMEDAFENDAQVQACVEFFEMFCSPKWQVRGAELAGYIPANTATMDRDYFSQSELHERYFGGAVQAMLENTRLIPEEPSIPAAEAINQEIPRQMWIRILQQGTPVEEAAQWAGKQINNELENAGRR